MIAWHPQHPGAQVCRGRQPCESQMLPLGAVGCPPSHTHPSASLAPALLYLCPGASSLWHPLSAFGSAFLTRARKCFEISECTAPGRDKGQRGSHL